MKHHRGLVTVVEHNRFISLRQIPIARGRIMASPVQLNDSNLDEILEKNSLVVVDCWAAWCGPCKMLAPIIHELSEEYEGRALIGKLNVDENPKTSMKHLLMAIPTLLFFKNGELVDHVVGVVPKANIEKTISKYL